MNCNEDRYRYSNQIQATFFMVVCCDETKQFVQKWLEYCEDYELLSPESSRNTNNERGKKFVVHREDQSILSLLCKKYGILPHKDPSQRGKYPETYYNRNYEFKLTKHSDPYKTVIFLHKSPTVNLINCIKLLIKTHLQKYEFKKAKMIA
jgi:hypothetical protein